MAEVLAFGCESAALVIGEAKSSAAMLFLEDAVLFEVGDDLCLLAVDPAREGGEQQLMREEVGHHAR